MKKIACIVKGYPRLSETFIAQEILALERAGINITIYSLRYPVDRSAHPIHGYIQAPVHYLPEYLYTHPVRLLLAVINALALPGFVKLVKVFVRDIARDFSFNRARRLGQALVLAREMKPDRQWLYAHFLHTPSSVARYCSILTGLPWSCSAHAKDIWTSPVWEIREKIQDMEWLVTCTAGNAGYLSDVSRMPEKVTLVYHGLDTGRFPDPPGHSSRNGQDQEARVRIVSVGRAVQKKGYDTLLEALARLPADFFWKFTHIGAGPELDTLKNLAASLGIEDRVCWLGPADFQAVLKLYRQADLFVLASRIDENGDRDGLPNVLMEAMIQEVPCVATSISGIPELLEHGRNGLVVEPGNAELISEAIVRLGQDPELRRSFGKQGREDVLGKFTLQANIRELISRFY